MPDSEGIHRGIFGAGYDCQIGIQKAPARIPTAVVMAICFFCIILKRARWIHEGIHVPFFLWDGAPNRTHATPNSFLFRITREYPIHFVTVK